MSSPRKPSQKRSQDRKDRILDAAVQILASGESSNFSMRDLARRADVNPASIYEYFQDKEDLILESVLRILRDSMLAAEGQLGNILVMERNEAVKHIVEFMFNRSFENQVLIRTVFVDNFSLFVGLIDESLERGQQATQAVIRYFAPELSAEEIEHRSFAATHAVGGLIFGIVLSPNSASRKFRERQVAEAGHIASAILFRG